MEDSTPRLVTFREPSERTLEDELYELALELVSRVHAVLEEAVLRFHLKDRLDRIASAIPLQLKRADDEIKSSRWRIYRQVLQHVIDCTTLLDIVAHQGCTAPCLAQARATAARLRDELNPLTLG